MFFGLYMACQERGQEGVLKVGDVVVPAKHANVAEAMEAAAAARQG